MSTSHVFHPQSLWRDLEPFPHEERHRIRQHLIEYLRNVSQNDYLKMKHGLPYMANPKYDRIWRAVGTIAFTWFYGTRYLSIQIEQRLKSP